MCNLNEVDGRAVDLFFAMRNGSGEDLPEGESAQAAVSAEHLQCVAKVLAPLDALSAPEPPADLAQRTLHKARRRAQRARAGSPGEAELGQVWNSQI